jgi:hypothetical protein
MAGDSWAAGVPIQNKESGFDIAYGGLTQLLHQQGNWVINLSRPGASNLQSCNKINDYFLFNDSAHVLKIKMIIFWQTEFFREIWHYKTDQLNKELEQKYTALRDHWVYRPYHRLSEISQRNNIPVFVIGGCSDTVWYDEFEKDFPGVRIACQSLTNLLINHNHRIDKPVFCQYLNGWVDPFLNLIKPKVSKFELQSLIEDMELGSQRITLLEQYQNVFFPDKLHPNTTAQTRLLDFLIETLPVLTNNAQVDQ